MLEIGGDRWRIGVLPQTGASLAHGRVRIDGQWRDLLRPTVPGDEHNAGQTASYVLVPFSNRVRDGVLHFQGRSWQLRPNGGDGNAMHGTGFEYPWQVVARSADAVTLELATGGLVGANFPWAFTATVRYGVAGDRFTITTSIRNDDGAAFPAGFGHHPFFRRWLTQPGTSEVELRLPCELSYPLEGAIPVGPPGPVPPAQDYRELRALATEPFVDACLTGRTGPVAMRWPDSGLALELDFDEIFEHVVCYLPLESDFFAVEPVTNANDGFNLLADGAAGHGVFVLEPGEACSGEIRMDLREL